MADVIVCLDSGTTMVKAAAFDLSAQMLCLVERPNTALMRKRDRVEQDMVVSQQLAFEAIRECIAKVGGRIVAIIICAHGDGLWPLDGDRRPVGAAMTWLDGRTGALISRLSATGQLQRIEDVTSSRPTSATQSIQLLWLKENEPERLAAIRYALRLKEWLFYSLTGVLVAEDTALLPTWGRWQDGALSRSIQTELGLAEGLELLPEVRPIVACREALSPKAALALGLPAGDVLIFLGPSDAQATAIGLGVGITGQVERCSIFGTSAIHVSHLKDPSQMPAKPAGAMIQRFALGRDYLCLHPGFNGTTVFRHLNSILGVSGRLETINPCYSQVILQPFLEPGGERAPYTSFNASAALLGLTSTTSRAQIQWAAREALAFVARKSHEMMSSNIGRLAIGGGLSNDPHFLAFFAATMRCSVARRAGSHAGLRGLGLIGAHHLLGESVEALAKAWLSEEEPLDDQQIAPDILDYADRKYKLFEALIDHILPFWDDIAAIKALGRDTTQPA